ncbi:hypothetical protein GCM10022276_03050 [Sphingomonas limnosediminicola]|uniref:Uncharacterized protein n=1 Tax=Sphingomonas limnosediminicola TaxID=940133 RepID=A0ABP7KU47_9SPHN
MKITEVTYAQASNRLAAEIKRLWGDDPGTVDDLQMKSMTCPVQGTNLVGTGIVCWPRGKDVRDGMAVAYYGPFPATGV